MMKKRAGLISLVVFLGSLGLCPTASAVLQSKKNPDEEALERPSVLVSSVESTTTATSATTGTQGPKTTIKMTFKPKTQPPPEPLEPQPDEGPPEDSFGYKSKIAPSIFLDENPHAIEPKGTSPSIKTVGLVSPGYKRSQVINQGRPKSTTTTSTLTVRQKTEE